MHLTQPDWQTVDVKQDKKWTICLNQKVKQNGMVLALDTSFVQKDMNTLLIIFLLKIALERLSSLIHVFLFLAFFPYLTFFYFTYI